MNENEKYLFDLRGYIVIKDVLTTSQIEDLRTRLENQRQTNPHPILGSDRTILGSESDPAWSAKSLIEMGGTYIELIDLPAIKPYLTTLVGDHYRLDHDYIKIDGAMKNKTLIYMVVVRVQVAPKTWLDLQMGVSAFIATTTVIFTTAW